MQTLPTLFKNLFFIAIYLTVAISPAYSQQAGDFVSENQYATANNNNGSVVISTSPVPDLLENNYRYNTSPFEQSNLATAYDPNANHWWQYFVYWDETRQAHITRRNFSTDGPWQSPVNIHGAIGGDALELDSHNTIAVGIDSEGYLHVSGNHHVDPLNYARSNTPHNINSFSNRFSMIPSDASDSEGRVTYPTFFNTADGELMFLYRNQLVSPSRFSTYLNRWNPSTKQWQRIAQIAEGRDLRFYHQRVAVDTTNSATRGRIHIMAMWRNDAGAGSGITNNEDLFHLYSDDNGNTWQQYGSSSSVELPLTIGQVDRLILDTRPHPNSVYFANQSGLEIDANGRPHALVTMSDQEGVQNQLYYHIWHTGQSWQVTKLNSIRPGNRSSIVTTRSGEVFGMITTSNSRESRMVLLNLTPGNNNYDSEIIPLTVDLTDSGSAANYDAASLYYHNRLSFVATRSPTFPASSNINYLQNATVVTVDLNQLNALRRSPYLAPALHTIHTFGGPVSTLANSQNPTNLYSTDVIDQDFNNRALSVRLTVTATMQGSGVGTVSLRHPSNSGPRQSGQLTFNRNQNQTLRTTVLPLFNFRSGTIDLLGSVSGGNGSLVISSVNIEILRINAAPLTTNNIAQNSVQPTAPVVSVQSAPALVCIDTDGDGWGWDGQASCLIAAPPTSEPPPPTAAAVQSAPALECIDTDGDGWGWDGQASCLIAAPQSATPLPTPSTANQSAPVLECIDTDGDGWGWDGFNTCIP